MLSFRISCYHKKTTNKYHWEISCSKNHCSSTSADRERADIKPNKEQCNGCKIRISHQISENPI